MGEKEALRIVPEVRVAQQTTLEQIAHPLRRRGVVNGRMGIIRLGNSHRRALEGFCPILVVTQGFFRVDKGCIRKETMRLLRCGEQRFRGNFVWCAPSRRSKVALVKPLAAKPRSSKHASHHLGSCL